MDAPIARALDGTPVACAYLLGSRAHGTERADSDTDIGVVLRPGVDGSLALVAELTVRLEDVGVRRPEVHLLQEAALAFQAEAVLRGRRIYSADEEARVRYETWVMTRYLDFEPLLQLQYRIQRQRLAREGTLGSARRR